MVGYNFLRGIIVSEEVGLEYGQDHRDQGRLCYRNIYDGEGHTVQHC